MANGTLKVQNIETSSGSGTITLGQSGETLALGSGVTSKMNHPAFEASLSADQSVSDNVATKVQIDTKIFDTDGYYDNTTNYRFTPLVAGKYYVYVSTIGASGTASTLNHHYTYIYKNGSAYKLAIADPRNNPGLKFSAYLDAVIDMNGTTDYLEIYGEVDVASGGTPHFDGATNRTYFGAYRIGVE